MKTLKTDRLVLREFSTADAAFVLELLNTPAWLEFIGDRGVRTLDDAQQYIVNKFIRSYETLGFGLYLLELKSDGKAIGTSGLLKREVLEDVDIGFALLPEYAGKGYAFEAASEIMKFATTELKLPRLAAITVSHNVNSIKLLSKLGLSFQSMIKIPLEEEELKLFLIDLKKVSS